MMPVAPTPVMPTPIKPKIGFSIESLVGQSAAPHHSAPREQISPPNLLSPTSSSRPSSSSNASRPSASRSPSPSPSARIESDDVRPRSFSPSNFGGGRSTHHHVARPHAQHHPHHHHPHTQSTPAAHHSPSSAGLRPNVRCDSPSSPVPHNLPPTGNGGGNMGLPNSSIHGPTLSLASSSGPFFDSVNSLKNIYAPEPTYTNGLIPGLAAPQPMSCAPMAHISHHPGIPNFSPLILGNFGGVGPHQLHRDAYPLYPWLLSRQGRFLGHRFQGPDAPAFLLQPFRKPKRIRTAFSPSQLLKLEHAFEKNHYVVGAERKHLAQNLSLTETQVKVWFQNRRTKHKRLKQEEEQSQCSPPSPKKKGSHHLNKWKMETQQSGDENSSGDEQ